MKLLSLVCFVVPLLCSGLGCSDSKQSPTRNNNVQEPSMPVGSVAGRVTDSRDGKPLRGVTVSTVVPCAAQCGATGSGATPASATTDADGHYAVTGLPGGAVYQVRFELSGYVSRFSDATVPNSSGEYPQGNAVAELNVDLAKADATISGNVFAREGTPAVGAVIAADLRPVGLDYVQEAVTDAQGGYALAGLPGNPAGLLVGVVVQPFDENRDGMADYDATSAGASTFPATTTQLDIDLRGSASEVMLLTSNIDDGEHVANTTLDPIDLLFNRPLDSTAIDVTLTDSDANKPVATTWSLDTAATTLSVKTAGGTLLSVSHSFQLKMTVHAQNGASGSFTRSFRVVSGSSSVPRVTGLKLTPEKADYDTSTFTLSWDDVPGAVGYRIYARDTFNNPSFLLVATTGSTAGPQVTVVLPNAFDFFTSDGVQTPLLYSTAVTFAVIPYTASGGSDDPSTATTVTVVDQTNPTISSQMQSASADNSAGSTQLTIDLKVKFSEYISETVDGVTITLPDSRMKATFELDPEARAGTFKITIPAGVNGTGSFTIQGVRDTSGNAMDPYSAKLESVFDVVVNGGFEDGNCSLDGWTTSHTSTADLPVATTTLVNTGACAARLGASGSTGQYGFSTIYQDVDLPDVATGGTITAAVAYHFTTTDPSSYDYVRCRVTTTQGSSLATVLSNVYKSTVDSGYLDASADITTLAGSKVRFICDVYEYTYVTTAYLDDLSIKVVLP